MTMMRFGPTRIRPGRHPNTVMPPSDEAGEFAGVYEDHARTIHRYLARRVGVDLADDLTADTFSVAFSGWASYDPTRGGVLPWLYGIAGHQLSRHRRREVSGYRALARHGIDPVAETGFESAVVDRDSAHRRTQALAGALAALSSFDRDVLLLVAWEDLTYEQVASALDVPVARVRSRLHQARKTLRSFEEKS
ncbi:MULTISPECIES: sigma-70 family RNA polymerase sigma factor [unclassified Rhodococcus (in: high G+C Gram-positive bacteria)]|uniref:RNA polymerase sigma factor n=1 Tax=unclassified Rhodococcus (in: high G+C Gram-positive bacteria) TaxID=192944 RepID=UPI001605289E|nr:MULTISPECIES: sigma-70 family RNA polymerase sigma factor [unclassified Rhodococcus (in: high G+C Gram-positive bacteria)]